MREIKFRAWNKIDEIMLTGHEDDNDYWDGVQGNSVQIINAQFTKKRLYNWMQFTGLYDIHGKEIYEGDILTSYVGKGAVKFGHCFVNGQEYRVYGFYIDNRDKELLDGETEAEVIGNIYESPELLEGKNG